MEKYPLQLVLPCPNSPLLSGSMTLFVSPWLEAISRAGCRKVRSPFLSLCATRVTLPRFSAVPLLLSRPMAELRAAFCYETGKEAAFQRGENP